jgi:DNA-binding protein Fis
MSNYRAFKFNPQQNRGLRNTYEPAQSQPQRHYQQELTYEGFGNSHEYEQPPIQHAMYSSTHQASQNTQRRMEQGITSYVPKEQESYYKALRDNGIAEMVDDVLQPTATTVDERMAQLTAHNERKAKQSMEYQSNATRTKFNRYFEQELDMHEHREWWSDPAEVYADNHVIF